MQAAAPAAEPFALPPMLVDRAHYHGWTGPLHSPWWAAVGLVRVALLQLFRRKLYWFMLALGLLQFLQFSSIIYGLTQLDLGDETQRQLLKGFGFSPEPEAGQESGYTIFMQRQGLVVALLLSFAGSMLVGADFRHHSLPFYLSRRIDRRHYIVGKLLAVSAIVALLTVVPAVLLFVEYGMLTSSFDYWIDNAGVLAAVFLYGGVMCLVLSALLVTLSAYLQRLVPIAIVWSCLFLLAEALVQLATRGDPSSPVRLCDPWFDIHVTSRWLYGATLDADERQFIPWAPALLATVCAGALALLTLRVRAVDVVT